jgi:membrane fusion protein (multidrug efflux system)
MMSVGKAKIRVIKSQLQIIGCAAALGSALMLSSCHGDKVEGSTTAPVPEVIVVTLKARPVTLTQELPGRTSAFLVAEVRPQVSGIVKRLLFTEGGYVKAGQSLYDLDEALYRAQYESALAAKQKAQASLLAAQLAANRSRELFRNKILSAQDNENTVAAEARAQADVAAADADVSVSGVNLAYAHIVAPISGRIGKSSVTQGALVTADQPTALATIQQTDPIYVEVNQSGSEWLYLKQAMDEGRVQEHGVGATAKIVLENGSTYSYDGKLQFADAAVDPGTGDFLLRIIVPNPKLVLLPGMYVRAILNEGVLRQSMLAPQQAITRDPKGNANALIVGKNGKVEQREVRLSRTIDNQWLVEGGLAQGDRVILEGSQKVTPGMTVRAVEQTDSKAARTESKRSPLLSPQSSSGTEQ